MSYTCDGHSGKYFKYKCYAKLDEYFNIKRESDRDNGILKQYFDSLQNNKDFVKRYYELFKLLSNHFGGDGLFYNPGFTVCCPYLNYWLNYKITYDHNELRGNDLRVFKEFADFYAKKRSETYYKNNSCEEYITPLYDHNYNTMETLYKMYELYNLNTRLDANYRKDTICTNYGLINSHYKDLKNIYTTDEELKNKLADFINVINTSKNSVKEVCHYEILPPESRREDSKPAPDSPGESASNPPKESQGLVTQTGPDGDSEVLAETKVAGPHSLESHTVITDQLESSVTQSEGVESAKLELLKAPLREGLDKVRSGARLLPGLRYQDEDRFGESLGRPDGEMDNPLYGLHNTQFRYPNTGEELSTTVGDTKGFFSNVQDTFSAIVDNVQPAPILGVSGGMGALFLLFKYTPVGSFFGGRRRRMHQIPSSFRGFPPGDFANFQEYDGGFIGYGPMNPLAE